MDSKSGDNSIENKLGKGSETSDIRGNELQTDGALVRTESIDVSTLTETLDCEEVVLDLGCKTPKECIFDPFAPGPEELCLAPKRKNGTLHLRRQLSLSFDLSFPLRDLEREFEELEKEEIESLCKSFLDLIISDVMESWHQKKMKLSSEGEEEEEELKTLTNFPLLTRFVDTRPGAPVAAEAEEEEGFKTLIKFPLLTGFADIRLGAPVAATAEEEEGFKTPTKFPLLTGFADTCPGAPVAAAAEEEGFKTPTNIPLLTGFADTCPGAPVAPVGPAMKLDSLRMEELCRKLNFDI